MQDFNRGTKYLEKHNYAKAAQFFRRQLAVEPFKECWLNLGNALNKLHKPTEACAALLQAADYNIPFLSGHVGPYPDAYNNLGLLAYAHNHSAQACEYFKFALQYDPLHYDAQFNLSIALLREFCSNQLDDCSVAWRLYQARFKRPKPTRIDLSIPLWDLHTPGSVCVVMSEQGLGDHIQFARYVPQLEHYFGTVIFECDKQLHSLFPQLTCVGDIHAPGVVGIPLLDLPARFGVVGGAHLRGVHKPHEFTKTRLNIGVEWSGSPTHANDYNRSCAPGYFAQLAKFGNLYSIRPNAPAVPGVTALNAQSWKQSAELVAGLDLVITVDTSLVHLAGSLGVKTWLLQPLSNTDFRWGNPSMGSNNIWYDSVEVIRNPDSWPRVFEQVQQKLEHTSVLHKYNLLKQELQKLLDVPC